MCGQHSSHHHHEPSSVSMEPHQVLGRQHEEQQEPPFDASIIIIDIGSGRTTAGFVGSDAPRSYFPTLIGRSTQHTSLHLKDRYVGDEALSKASLLDTMHRPIQRGLVQNWDEYQCLLHHLFFNELRVAPEEHPICFTESIVTSTTNDREKWAQILFETFAVPALHAVLTPQAVLMASGRSTGVAVDSGYGLTYAVPVVDGVCHREHAQIVEMGGHEVDEYWMGVLLEQGQVVGSDEWQVRRVAESIKTDRSVCEVSLDYDRSEQEDAEVLLYELPDGNTLSIGRERYQCTELLFQPHHVMIPGLEGCAGGIHELTYSAVNACDMAHRAELYGNVVLSGGNTMFRGFAERLQAEVVKLAPHSIKIGVVELPERKFSSYIGACCVAGLSTERPKWMRLREYEEEGVTRLIHRKFKCETC